MYQNGTGKRKLEKRGGEKKDRRRGVGTEEGRTSY